MARTRAVVGLAACLFTTRGLFPPPWWTGERRVAAPQAATLPRPLPTALPAYIPTATHLQRRGTPDAWHGRRDVLSVITGLAGGRAVGRLRLPTVNKRLLSRRLSAFYTYNAWTAPHPTTCRTFQRCWPRAWTVPTQHSFAALFAPAISSYATRAGDPTALAPFLPALSTTMRTNLPSINRQQRIFALPCWRRAFLDYAVLSPYGAIPPRHTRVRTRDLAYRGARHSITPALLPVAASGRSMTTPLRRRRRGVGLYAALPRGDEPRLFVGMTVAAWLTTLNVQQTTRTWSRGLPQ